MSKRLLLLSTFLLSIPCVYAAGPVFRHKEPEKQLEFQNIYRKFDTIRQTSTTLPSGSTHYIQNTSSPQTARFNVSSGTLNGPLYADQLFFLEDGTNSAPAASWQSDSNTGFYRVAADRWGIAAGGTIIATINSSAINSAKTASFSMPNSPLESNNALFIPHGELVNSYAGGEAGWMSISRGDNGGFYIGNGNDVRLLAGSSTQGSVSYSSKNDASRYFTLSGDPFSADVQPVPGRTFTVGANSYTVRAFRNANKRLFVYEDISGEAASGTLTNVIYHTSTMKFSASNFAPIGAGSISSGDASNYWNDISYKTLTDRGCLGFFDDGVEVWSGGFHGKGQKIKVSDLEAICRIKKHPTKTTVYGAPMLDYRTFPIVSYTPASVNGKQLPRDRDDEPIGGSDGVEMTSFQSIMIGAFKEVKARLDEQEEKIASLEKEIAALKSAGR